MTALYYRDFAGAGRDPDCSRPVVQIYQAQFPELYRAVETGQLRTQAGSVLQLGGDTLITYNGAIRRIFGKRWSEPGIRRAIRRTLEAFSTTSEKRIECWDEHKDAVINNHQIGNMMPFPSGNPSLNSRRFDQLDYFDRFLIEVEQYYETCSSYEAISAMQKAIRHYSSYFDFFDSYERFITENLLQDFVGKDLWSITDFEEYVCAAHKIIDNRGRRFSVTATCS